MCVSVTSQPPGNWGCGTQGIEFVGWYVQKSDCRGSILGCVHDKEAGIEREKETDEPENQALS